MSDNDYQFEDVETDTASAVRDEGARPSASNGNGSYSTELFTKQVKAKFRTFFIDLKESGNGKFLKISEKSNGRKSTIMMDAEDVPAMIEALQAVQEQL